MEDLAPSSIRRSQCTCVGTCICYSGFQALGGKLQSISGLGRWDRPHRVQLSQLTMLSGKSLFHRAGIYVLSLSPTLTGQLTNAGKMLVMSPHLSSLQIHQLHIWKHLQVCKSSPCCGLVHVCTAPTSTGRETCATHAAKLL